MVIEVWLTYLAATLALLAVPGPVVMLLLGYTMAGGRSVAAAAIPGVVLPQFIDPALPILPQIVILEATFAALVLVSTVIWILLAAKATDCLRHPSTRSLVSRIGASWLIGAAVVTAVRA